MRIILDRARYIRTHISGQSAKSRAYFHADESESKIENSELIAILIQCDLVSFSKLRPNNCCSALIVRTTLTMCTFSPPPPQSYY